MIDKIKLDLKRSIECKEKLLNDENVINNISKVCDEMIKCYNNGHRVYICGNGGSAADAQHFAAELVGRYLLERKAIPATAFTTDTSILTSIGNDYGYDDIFRRQVEALVEEGDIFIIISTSGNSANLVYALEEATKKGAITVGLLGKTGGKCKELCTYPIVVNWDKTPNIQESHITIIHTICGIVEESLYEK